MLLLDFENRREFKQNLDETDQKVLDFIQEWKQESEFLSVFTSGSTGKPKEIKINKSYIKASVQMSTDAFLLDKEDVFVCNLSTDSIAGKMMVIRAYELKARLLSIPPSSDPLADFLNFEEKTSSQLNSLIFAFVPMQLKSILANKEKTTVLKRAKAILIGGAGISQELENNLIALDLSFWATYGMTETVTHVAIRRLGQKEFTALKSVKLAISTKGTLKIASPSTGNIWIETNDLVILNESQNKFEILGRADNTINSGGVKIQLEKVESTLVQICGLLLFCFGLPDELLGTKLCCAYEKTADIALERETFKGKMSNFEIPKQFYALEKFIYTKSGKIDKLKTIDAYIEPKISNQ